MDMNSINTDLSEKEFVSRLEKMCMIHRKFDKGYQDLDVFVVKRNNKKFRLGHHLPLVGRTDGYSIEYIFGEYVVDKNNRVIVTYRFGKTFLFLMPFFIAILFSLPIFIYLVYDLINNSILQLDGLIISFLISTLSLTAIFLRSKNEKDTLEKHLHRICLPSITHTERFD